MLERLNAGHDGNVVVRVDTDLPPEGPRQAAEHAAHSGDFRSRHADEVLPPSQVGPRSVLPCATLSVRRPYAPFSRHSRGAWEWSWQVVCWMWCCGSCGSECVTGEFIVSKPTSNQQFHTQKQFEAQQPAHSQAPPLACDAAKWCMLSRVNNSR